jgi:succinate dehydrogenase cytochrome b556 subunit
MHSWLGRVLLFGCTFSFFFHLCNGIRHLVWDAGYGFELRTTYVSGWTVVAASTALTVDHFLDCGDSPCRDSVASGKFEYS